MPSLGTLTAHLSLNDKQWSGPAEKARAQLGKIGSSSRKAANDLGKLGVGLGVAGAAIVANITKKSADAARELRTLTQVANASAEEFQKGAFAVRSVGIETDKYADILKDMSDRVGDFISTGGGPMADFFENIAPKVGVTAEQFRNLSGPQALQLYVDSLEKANLSQAEMTFYMETIASDSSRLIPLLQNQGAEMQKLGSRAEDLGVVLSDLELERLTMLGDSMDQAATQVDKLTQRISSRLAPVMIAVSNHFINAASDATDFGDSGDDAMDTIVNATGFVLDAIEGIKRSFQVAGRFLAIFGLSAKDVMLTLARDIVEFPTAATNELIDLLNKLPGIDIMPQGMTELGKSIDAEIQLTRNAVDEGWKDINNILMKPLPSSQFKVMVDEIEAEAERAVKQSQKVREAMSLRGGMDVATDTDEDEKKAKEDEEFAQKLDRLRQQNLTEAQLLQEKQQRELEILREGKERELAVKGGYDKLEREMKSRHEKELTGLTEKAAEQRRRIEEQKLKARQATTGQILGNLTTLMNTESRKMFEVGKAAGIANAIISTYTGASKALELGWPLGPIAAGAIIAKGFAQVSAIKSQSFGGGGSASSGGAASVTQGINAQGQPIQGSSESGGQNITLNPVNPNDLFTGQQVLDLVNESIRNGGQIVMGT